jgi:parallel beta-helix repeat protein
MKWLRSRTAVVVLVAVAAALTFSLGAWQGWLAQAAGNVVYVNDNLLPDVEGCNDPDANTIAGGITAADSDDTVIVCEGTYDGGVTVNKDALTIEGRPEADRDDIIVQAASDGLVVPNDGVTIRHMYFAGGTGDGIYVTGDEATIQDVEAVEWDTGIDLGGSSGSLVEDSDVDDNDTGIAAIGGGDNVIRNNVAGDGNGTGLWVQDEDVDLVAGNDLAGTVEALYLNADAGLLNVRVINNTIHAGSDGIYIDVIPSAESLIVIGGCPDAGNTFDGTPDGVSDFFVEMACGAGPPDTEVTVDATWNYWGGLTTRTTIADSIYDDEDQNECGNEHGAVVFHPWATEPPPTPSPSPTPTPTPSPTPSPSPTPGTRTFDLQMGWNDFVWTGPTGTDPATALSCIDGNYVIAYRYVALTQAFQRYVPGNATLSTMTNLNKYDSLLVLVTTAAGVQCQDMPVDPDP